jgi:hypothetical protein
MLNYPFVELDKHGHAKRRVPTALITWVVIVVVGIVALSLIGLKLFTSPIVTKVNPFPSASPHTLSSIHNASLSSLDETGAYEAAGLGVPERLSNQAALLGKPTGTQSVNDNGRELPEVAFVGSEYCPYCAAASWPVVIALSRFGSFDRLDTATSSSSEVFSGINGFSFYMASYNSKYIYFNGTEEASSVPSSNPYSGFTPLTQPGNDLMSLMQHYDRPPFTSPAKAGELPFVDIANKSIFSGALFSAELLQRKGYGTITYDIAHPSHSYAGQAILTSANVLTASICTVTGNAPENVCSSPAIHQASALL